MTERELPRFLPSRRYTVHALKGGHEQTVRFYSGTTAHNVAHVAEKAIGFGDFDLRSVYSSIYYD